MFVNSTLNNLLLLSGHFEGDPQLHYLVTYYLKVRGIDPFIVGRMNSRFFYTQPINIFKNSQIMLKTTHLKS